MPLDTLNFGFAGRDDKAVVLIPKAGCRSIRAAVGKEMTKERAYQCKTRLAFIRHPIERLASAWSHFFWMSAIGMKHRGPTIDVTCDWYRFVDHMLEYPDPHYHPQAEIVGDFANVIYRFEDLGQVWESYFPGFFPHLGKTTRLQHYPYRVRDITDRYREDFELWHSASPVAAQTLKRGSAPA